MEIAASLYLSGSSVSIECADLVLGRGPPPRLGIVPVLYSLQIKMVLDSQAVCVFFSVSKECRRILVREKFNLCFLSIYNGNKFSQLNLNFKVLYELP